MKLYSIKGGTQAALENKEYTIGVGISLGSRWFTPENICGHIAWALPYSRDKVVVYAADSIQALNIRGRTGLNVAKAAEKAKEDGKRILKRIQDAVVTNFSEEDRKRIVFRRWHDLVDSTYQAKVDFLYKEFDENDEFKSSISAIVEDHIKNEERSFSEASKLSLCHYVLEELPELCARVQAGGIVFDAYTSPYDTELTRFVERIQQGGVFPEIGGMLVTTEPKVFLEVR